MGVFAIRMPDIGEGIAEAELAEWLVAVGDQIQEDAPLAAVMTDKATVEIPSPHAGKVAWLGGEIGDIIAVGAEFIRLEVHGDGNVAADLPPASAPAPRPAAGTATPAPEAAPTPATSESIPATPEPAPAPARSERTNGSGGNGIRPGVVGGPPRPEGAKPLARPSVRARAREAGVDLRYVPGTGPAGHIGHDDLDRYLASGTAGWGAAAPAPDDSVTEVKIVGLRRRIAERMELSARDIPHITIVEEVDLTAVEELRKRLNARQPATKLTVLPFVMTAIVRAVADQPTLNAHYDGDAGVIREFAGVHLGVATQTPGGLMVPVVRHAETLSLHELAAELARVAEAARTGTATRDELSGSTITVTSLGPLGALATTPIINHPEVAIVGVNKMQIRPVWDGAAFVPRTMMNLSSSFDHRVVDGWDAAVFVQRIKELLELPALMFVEGPA